MSPLLEAAAAITLILGCLTGIGLALKRMWLGTRRVVHAVDIIQRELNPNGGGSTYDRAKIAAEASQRAEVKAEQVAADLAVFREHQATDSATAAAALARVQHDVTNVRAGQEMLLDEVDRVSDTAKRATEAADSAVTEASAQISELREVTDALAKAMADDQRDRVVKERAYIAALNKIGVPLLPIADELET